jgi:hypothetical protein
VVAHLDEHLMARTIDCPPKARISFSHLRQLTRKCHSLALFRLALPIAIEALWLVLIRPVAIAVEATPAAALGAGSGWRVGWRISFGDYFSSFLTAQENGTANALLFFKAIHLKTF